MLALALLVIGVALLVAGAAMVAPAAGVAVAGLALVGFGWDLSSGDRR